MTSVSTGGGTGEFNERMTHPLNKKRNLAQQQHIHLDPTQISWRSSTLDFISYWAHIPEGLYDYLTGLSMEDANVHSRSAQA